MFLHFCEMLFLELVNITSVIFKSESSSSTLTCNSTGSPPTTVTWIVKDGQRITMRDGDSETRNGINYHLKQTVTDRKHSTYSNVLSISSTSVLVGNIVCTVSNVWTSDTKRIDVRGKFIVQYSYLTALSILSLFIEQ